jgi:ABC-2 type transport system ATP-binding protein
MMDDPEILILDEPTSGLDPNQIVEIRDIIRRIGKEKTVILSTHILSEAEATCDRVVIINQGKIVADGNIESLKQSASDTNLINLVFRSADFEAVKNEMTAIDGIGEIVKVDENNDLLQVRLSLPSTTDLRPDIYRKIKQTDWILLEFYQETQTLESIFRELTKEN